MTINVLLYLINEENVKVDNIEILTLFAAQQYFIRREILSLCKVMILNMFLIKNNFFARKNRIYLKLSKKIIILLQMSARILLMLI